MEAVDMDAIDIPSFVAQMDLTKPKWFHLSNVQYWTLIYNWNSELKGKLIQEINKLYGRKL